MKRTKILKKNYEFRLVLNKGKYYSGTYIEAFSMNNKVEYNRIRNSNKNKNSEKQ